MSFFYPFRFQFELAQTNQHISSGKDFCTRKTNTPVKFKRLSNNPAHRLFQAFSWLGRSAKNGERKNRGEAWRQNRATWPRSTKPNIAGNSTPTRAVGRHHLLLLACPTYVLDLPWKLFWCLWIWTEKRYRSLELTCKIGNRKTRNENGKLPTFKLKFVSNNL